MVLFVLMSSTTCGQKQRYDDESYFKVSLVEGGNGVMITSYIGSKQTVNIPPRHSGLPVVSIEEGVFRRKQLINVTIPNRVTTIGYSAFTGNQLHKCDYPKKSDSS